MAHGGLITAAEITTVGDAGPIAVPVAITWQGWEFLDAVRDDAVWAAVTRELQDRGISLPLGLLQDLCLRRLRQDVCADVGLTGAAAVDDHTMRTIVHRVGTEIMRQVRAGGPLEAK